MSVETRIAEAFVEATKLSFELDRLKERTLLLQDEYDTLMKEVVTLEKERAQLNLTVNHIGRLNRLLHKVGVPEDVTLRRGKDYFYFTGGSTAGWYSSGVYAYRLTDLTVGQWAREYVTLSSQNETEEA